MKKVLLVLGFTLVIISIYYLFNLIIYLQKSYDITNYGYGILTGKIILLIIGIFLIYFGFKNGKKKTKSP